MKELVRYWAGGVANYLARTIDPWLKLSYSQEGEDLLLCRIFEGKKAGFYVDVGAHHPKRFSNTFLFYESGWSGINIEPNPSAMAIFAKERKRDINLQVGVSSQQGELLYFEFNEPALNTFDNNLASEREETTSYKIIATQKIPVNRLDSLLEKYVPVGVVIDFLTVDVEGLDLEVLRSNDWNRFRPRCVLAEALGLEKTFAFLEETPMITYMQKQGYRLFAKTYNSLFFLDSETADKEALAKV